MSVGGLFHKQHKFRRLLTWSIGRYSSLDSKFDEIYLVKFSVLLSLNYLVDN